MLHKLEMKISPKALLNVRGLKIKARKCESFSWNEQNSFFVGPNQKCFYVTFLILLIPTKATKRDRKGAEEKQ